MTQILNLFESTTIPCTARDGVNLPAFGAISPLQAAKGKKTSALFELNLQSGEEHPASMARFPLF